MPERVLPPAPHVRTRMQLQRTHGTEPELELRRRLWSKGLRYRVGLKVPGNSRRTIDIAFTKARVAVFVDGCFWHRCPEHSVPVKNNGTWWEKKLLGNAERDRSTDASLVAAGWLVLRFWEHADMDDAATQVARAVRSGSR